MPASASPGQAPDNAPNPAPHPAPRYLRWFFASALAAVLLAGALNVLIDPLDLFGSPRVAGLNRLKPHLDHHREFTRWRQAQRLCPSGMILGNSRAEIGFDPSHPGFTDRGLSVANQAVPGTSAATAYQQLLWASRSGCMPKLLVVGIEFFDFLDATPPRSLAQLQASTPPALDGRAAAEVVFSIAGLGDSLATLALQRARYPAILTERGFNPLLHYEPEVARSGHQAMFRQRAVENARVWARKPRLIRPPGDAPSEDRVALRAVLDLARASGSEVHLVIYPYHAQVRLMMQRMALDGLFSDWKRDIVQMAGEAQGAASVSGSASRSAPVSLWDFSGVSPITTEAIPAAGDRQTRLQHYWEAGHFKKALGDRMLAQMLGQTPGFGVKLDATMLDDWLARDQAAVNRLCAAPSALCDLTAEVLRQAGVAPVR